jgi:uncharacterized damage-inducible protein DinB
LSPEESRSLFAYDSWANELALEALSEVSPEELHRDLGSSHESLFGTFVHVVAAEEIWLSRWKGAPRQKLTGVEDIGSLEALRDWWRRVREERDAFVESLDPSALEAIHEITTTQGATHRHRLEDMVRHLVNHSTYHRGQLAGMLRQLGKRPKATDLVRFYRESG